MLQACSQEGNEEMHTIELQSVVSRSEKPTRLRAVVPRRRRYIFPFSISQIQVNNCNKTIAMMMKLRHAHIKNTSYQEVSENKALDRQNGSSKRNMLMNYVR